MLFFHFFTPSKMKYQNIYNAIVISIIFIGLIIFLIATAKNVTQATEQVPEYIIELENELFRRQESFQSHQQEIDWHRTEQIGDACAGIAMRQVFCSFKYKNYCDDVRGAKRRFKEIFNKPYNEICLPSEEDFLVEEEETTQI